MFNFPDLLTESTLQEIVQFFNFLFGSNMAAKCFPFYLSARLVLEENWVVYTTIIIISYCPLYTQSGDLSAMCSCCCYIILQLTPADHLSCEPTARQSHLLPLYQDQENNLQSTVLLKYIPLVPLLISEESWWSGAIAAVK